MEFLQWIAENYGGWAVLLLIVILLYNKQITKNTQEEKRRDELDAYRLKMEDNAYEQRRKYEESRDRRLEASENQRIVILQAIEKALVQTVQSTQEHTSILERLAKLLDDHEDNATKRTSQIASSIITTADATQANSRSLTGQIIKSVEDAKREILAKIDAIIEVCDKKEVLDTLHEIQALLGKE